MSTLTAAAALTGILPTALPAEEPLKKCPIAVFSKIYQELKLNFKEAAEITAEAGLNGVDCPVRPAGEISPERATDLLPEYAVILRERGLKVHLLTTAITSPKTPHTETVLRAAAKLGVRHYRLGAFKRDKNLAFEKQLAEIQSGLRDLASLNQELGMLALFQNHQGSFGADLDEMGRLLQGLEKARIGAAFDIGHALVVHGSDWRKRFEQIRPHLSVAYVKDSKMGGSWTSFGAGDISQSGYFRMLKDLGYNAPFSLHIEYDWHNQGGKTRSALLRELTHSRKVLQSWLDHA